jgi:hypothetical protein
MFLELKVAKLFVICAECLYTECRYAECRYAECHYTECRKSAHYAECCYAECCGPVKAAKDCKKVVSYLIFLNTIDISQHD